MYVVANVSVPRALATSTRHFFGWNTDPDDEITVANLRRETSRALRAIQESVVHRAFETVVITSTVPSDVEYVLDSASPPAAWDEPRRTLTWTFASPPITSTVSYDVIPVSCGSISLPIDSWAWGRDLEGTEYRHDYSPTAFEVPCPTATPTASNTPTAEPEPTATAPPTATASPSPMPTAEPGAIYLPIAVREPGCTPDRRRMDVALAIDASTSMLERSAAGRTKLEAATAAARSFVELLGSRDQAAIVQFNAEARVLQPLTSDRRALDAAIGEIEPSPQTCLVCAVDVAATELASDRRRPDNTAVLILLTDGKSNPRPIGEAEERAVEAKRSGVTVFTIGLGDDLDVDSLERIASRPEYFKRAPDAEDLAAVYASIAVEIPCPADTYWVRR